MIEWRFSKTHRFKPFSLDLGSRIQNPVAAIQLNLLIKIPKWASSFDAPMPDDGNETFFGCDGAKIIATHGIQVLVPPELPAAGEV